jgi:glycosyltransferase involved in cell wall biosynthesis
LPGQLSFFHPSGQFALKSNPFGKDVANLELARALAVHGGFDAFQLLGMGAAAEPELIAGLLGGASTATQLSAGSILDQRIPAASGALLRGQPYLYELAWLRRSAVGDRAYSLLGLVHTIAPPAIRQDIAQLSVGPIQPWDAVICTSPVVRDALAAMFDQWEGHLAERTGGSPPPRPQLPVLPLGVDAAAFAKPTDPQAIRARLKLADEEVLVLWVGRLSYYEKAFPQPMLKAVREAARAAGKKATFALAGWFPSPRDRQAWEQAIAAYAGDVRVEVLDGNDRSLLAELWAGADIFLSLVDNIQETFGITPLEAMAAGLPVVASDWDGYRSTLRHGVEAFLIPTLLPPGGGRGEVLARRHALELDSYQAYAGTVAQHTAVHVRRAAEALAALMADPELRRRMGAAGQARIRERFDWPVVARAYRALTEELAAIRRAAPDPPARQRVQPMRGDPFGDFAGFATHTLGLDSPIAAVAGVSGADVLGTGAVDLDQAFAAWRGTREECARALDILASGEAKTAREVLTAFPTERRRAVELGLAWMAKLVFVDWLT